MDFHKHFGETLPILKKYRTVSAAFLAGKTKLTKVYSLKCPRNNLASQNPFPDIMNKYFYSMGPRAIIVLDRA